jgi:hypothetical protein
MEIVEKEVKDGNEELIEISRQLVELKEISMMIGRELGNQNKKIEKIEILLEDNNNIMDESNKKMDEIKKEIKDEKRYSKIMIISGIMLIPISIKIGLPIIIMGYLVM